MVTDKPIKTTLLVVCLVLFADSELFLDKSDAVCWNTYPWPEKSG